MNKNELSPQVLAILAAFTAAKLTTINSAGEVYEVAEVEEFETYVDIYTDEDLAFYRVPYAALDAGIISEGAVEFKLGSNTILWRLHDFGVGTTTPESPLDIPFQGPRFTLAELEDLESVLEYVTENEQTHYEETCEAEGGDVVQNHVYARASRVQAALLRFQQ